MYDGMSERKRSWPAVSPEQGSMQPCCLLLAPKTTHIVEGAPKFELFAMLLLACKQETNRPIFEVHRFTQKIDADCRLIRVVEAVIHKSCYE